MNAFAIDVGAFVAFPRARDDASPAYAREYAHDCRKLLFAWVAKNKALADFNDVFVLAPDTEADALVIATGEASKEIGRALLPHEARLLANVVRDFTIATTALRLAAELRAVAKALNSETSAQRGYDREVVTSAATELTWMAERFEGER